MIPTPSIQALKLTEAQRTTLAEWADQLAKLVQQQRRCRARKVHGSLGVHLASAIRAASAAIGEVCAEAENDLLATATRTIAPYFHHAGDARNAARQFPAFAELRGFLRGPKGEDSLSGLADQAEAVGALIGRILDGGDVWKFGRDQSELSTNRQ